MLVSTQMASQSNDLSWLNEVPSFFFEKPKTVNFLSALYQEKLGRRRPELSELLDYEIRRYMNPGAPTGITAWFRRLNLLGRPQSPGLSPIEYKIYLAQYAEEAADFPIETRLRLFRKLHFENLYTSASKVLLYKPVETFDFVLENFDTHSEGLGHLFSSLEANRGHSRHFQSHSKWYRTLRAWYKEKKRNNPAYNTTLNETAYMFNPNQRFFGREETNDLGNEIDKERGRFTSLIKNNAKDLLQMLTLAKGFTRRGLRRSEYIYTMLTLINDGPETFLKTKADIDLLLDSEEMWPLMASKPPNLNDRSGLPSLITAFYFQISGKRSKIYNPKEVAKLHKSIIARLKELGEYPNSRAELYALWKKLTTYGGSHLTDEIFIDLDGKAGENLMAEHYPGTLEERRFFDPSLISKLAWIEISESPDMQTLVNSQSRGLRNGLIKKIVAKLKTYLPFRGPYYTELLERLSNHILSNREEAAMLEDFKREEAKGESKQGIATRIFSSISRVIMGLETKKQWEFIRFLRRETDKFEPLDNALGTIGSESFRGLFDNLPRDAKVGMIDLILSNPKGVLPLNDDKIDTRSRNFKMIINHVLRDTDRSTKNAVSEVLKAVIAGLNGAGMGPFGTHVIANVLVSNKDRRMSGGEILAETLKHVGALGIKIGQIILAANILPPQEAKYLIGLTEMVDAPPRHSIYEDLASQLGDKLNEYDIKELLGAASTKYVVAAIKKALGKKVALKVLKSEALNTAPIQFDVVSAMAEDLTGKDKFKYLKFSVVASTAIRSVERQLDPALEVERTRVARERLYTPLFEGDDVRVPYEEQIAERVTESEFIEGQSLFAIAEEHPDLARRGAELLIRREAYNLFRTDGVELEDGRTMIVFDPDRHRGNTRFNIKIVETEDQEGEPVYALAHSDAHIDMGELLEMSLSQRAEIIKLFAIAQIAAQSGAAEWVLSQMKTLEYPMKSVHLYGIFKTYSTAVTAHFITENLVKLYVQDSWDLLNKALVLDSQMKSIEQDKFDK
ncbi:MAG: hypothetical protein AAF202_02060, partial [Pseudomonadota bacterium]